MAVPHRAIVLAAGLGTRMRPFTRVIPKPLLPLWDRAAILRVLDSLHAWGVRDVLVNLHHHAARVLEDVRSEAPPGIRLNFSFEPAILGTGGAVKRASWFVHDGAFLLVNADIVVELDPSPLAQAMHRHGTLAALWMTDADGPRTVRVRDGTVGSFHVARPGRPGTYTFCGLHLVSPDVLEFMPAQDAFSIIDVYRRAQRAGRRIAGVCVPGSLWCDIGTPDSYLAAHEAYRQRFPDRCRNRPAARCFDALELPVEATGDADLAAAVRALRWPAARTRALPLARKGSDRRFTRIRCGHRRAMVVTHGTARPENEHYARHARLLARAGVRVPVLLRHLPSRRTAVFEDVGGTALLDWVRDKSEHRVRALYGRILECVHTFHTHGARAAARAPLCQPFGPALYRWERELFAEHFLRGHLHEPGAVVRRILRELETVPDHLAGRPRVLLHRDLQSTNILLRGREPVLIDFQSMRMGPAAYDVASLLCDPYVSLPASTQAHVLDRLASRHPAYARQVRDAFWWAAVQRLVQALGAFGRLSAVPGVTWYRPHIRPALKMLDRALLQVQTLPCTQRWVKRALAKAD
jgi:aminoglycoside/choline kinase family phosphotransferase/dTDP-glucose pyrophosphorylase